jgi:hypothetical protein
VTFTRKSRALAAWLAFCAMALNAAWPLLANAAPAPTGTLIDVCTVGGLQKVADTVGHAPATGVTATHCSFCLFSSDTALAQAPGGVRAIASTGELRSTVRGSPDCLAPLFSPSAPRAPPIVS